MVDPTIVAESLSPVFVRILFPYGLFIILLYLIGVLMFGGVRKYEDQIIRNSLERAAWNFNQNKQTIPAWEALIKEGVLMQDEMYESPDYVLRTVNQRLLLRRNVERTFRQSR